MPAKNVSPDLANDRIMRRPEVEKYTGLSRSQIYSLIAQGNFPSQVHLGPRSVGWRQSEVVEWLQSRIEGSAA